MCKYQWLMYVDGHADKQHHLRNVQFVKDGIYSALKWHCMDEMDLGVHLSVEVSSGTTNFCHLVKLNNNNLP